MDIVLGGGITGLTLAQEADMVITAQPTTAMTFSVGEYKLDRGIHVLNQKVDVVELEETERNAKILTESGFVDYPYRSPHTDFKVCEGSVSYKEFLVNSFGQKDFDDFHKHYNEKFWGVNLDFMSSEWTKKPHFPKGAGANAKFYYPKKGGIGALTKALQKKVEKKIQYGHIKFIDVNRKVVYTDMGEFEYTRLHSTIPLNKINTTLPFEGVQEKLHNTSMYVYSFAVDYSDLAQNYRDVHWVYFPYKDNPFVRASFPTNWNKNLAPKGRCIVQCESPYLIEDTPERYLYVNEICRNAVLLYTDRVMPAYCVPLHDTVRNVGALHLILEKYDVYCYGRYGRWTNMWMHECLDEKIS